MKQFHYFISGIESHKKKTTREGNVPMQFLHTQLIVQRATTHAARQDE